MIFPALFQSFYISLQDQYSKANLVCYMKMPFLLGLGDQAAIDPSYKTIILDVKE